MRPAFRLVEHPADLGIEACGATVAEVFEQAALALVSVLLDPSGVRPLDELPVRLEGSDREELLVRWLSEVLYLVDGKGFAPKSFRVHLEGATALRAAVRGERRDPERHTGGTDIKAVTYHRLSVREEDGGWIATVVLDV